MVHWFYSVPSFKSYLIVLFELGCCLLKFCCYLRFWKRTADVYGPYVSTVIKTPPTFFYFVFSIVYQNFWFLMADFGCYFITFRAIYLLSFNRKFQYLLKNSGLKFSSRHIWSVRVRCKNLLICSKILCHFKQKVVKYDLQWTYMVCSGHVWSTV